MKLLKGFKNQITKFLAKQVVSNTKENYVPFVSEVEEFNAIMGKPNNYNPVIPAEKEWMFVYNFILEELEEYKHACETGNIVEVLDALCDITYVSLGNGAMLHGLKDKVWPAYQEVQASNLSKACTSKKEAQETVRVRSEEQKTPCHYEKVGRYYIVYRSSDKKVMKSINYFRPETCYPQAFLYLHIFKIILKKLAYPQAFLYLHTK
jgi:hypothetical protein